RGWEKGRGGGGGALRDAAQQARHGAGLTKMLCSLPMLRVLSPLHQADGVCGGRNPVSRRNRVSRPRLKRSVSQLSTQTSGGMLSRVQSRTASPSIPPRKHAEPAKTACFRGRSYQYYCPARIRESMPPGY